MYGRGTPASSGPAAASAAGEMGCGCGRASVRGSTTCVGARSAGRTSGTASVCTAAVLGLGLDGGVGALDVVAEDGEKMDAAVVLPLEDDGESVGS